MTPADWFAGLAAGTAALSVFGGAVYIVGQMRARDRSHDERFDELGKQITRLTEAITPLVVATGAQTVRNLQTETMADDMRDVRDRLTRVETGLERHETECARRQEEIKEHFRSVEQFQANLSAQINNLARNDAGVYAEVIRPKRVTGRGGRS